MKSVLVLYGSRRGHTARVARTICESITASGGRAEMMAVREAVHEGVDWSRYDVVAVGAPVIYGTYDKEVFQFVADNKNVLDGKPNSFFNVTVIARNPAKATPEGNVYCRKFLENNPWHPKDVKCFAGKVDYPNWSWIDAKLIQMIMKMTKGPTEMTAVIDYTDWEAVEDYARHCLTLEA